MATEPIPSLTPTEGTYVKQERCCHKCGTCWSAVEVAACPKCEGRYGASSDHKG